MKRTVGERIESVIVEEVQVCTSPPGMELGTSGMCHAYGRRKQDFCDGCQGDGYRLVRISSKKKRKKNA